MKSTIKTALLAPFLLLIIIILPFLNGNSGGEGWLWALQNGLGFVALAGVLYLALDTRHGSKVNLHKKLSYVVLGVSTAHALSFFLVHPQSALSYLSLGAPWYMWTGLLALLLLCFVIYSSQVTIRKREFSHYRLFKWWHRAIALIAIAFMLHHIIASGFYLETRWQQGLLIVMTLLCSGLSIDRFKVVLKPLQLLMLMSVLLVLFVVVRGRLF